MASPGLAPRRGKPRRPPRARTLSQESIVDAALRIVDVEGVDAVTMRRVAEELGTGGASLYAHVSDKDELLELVFDRVLGEVPLDIIATERTWQAQVKALFRAWRTVLLQHGDVAKVGFGQVPVGPNALRGMETMLAVLRRSKASDDVIAYAADLLSGYVVAQSYEASQFSARKEQGDDPNAYEAEILNYLEQLPQAEFPTLTSMATALVGDAEDGDARFEFGLDVIIQGLSKRSAR